MAISNRFVRNGGTPGSPVIPVIASKRPGEGPPDRGAKQTEASNRAVILDPENIGIFMVTFTAFTGCGLGVGLVSIMISLAEHGLPNSPDKSILRNLWPAFGMVLLIAGISSYIGVRKALEVGPFDIFRG